MFEVKGTAVVTGGASGIGHAVAEALARAGATVWILDLNEAAAESAALALREAGFPVFARACDVTAFDSIRAAIDALGPVIDVLVNSAGVSHVGTVETTDDEAFDRLFRVNVAGTYHAMRAVVPLMKARGHGVIVNLASVAAAVGLSDRFAYSMTKGAVVSMTLSVAKDYVAHGIRCNCVSPGRVHTPFVDHMLAKNYPGQEAAMLETLSRTQPVGRMGLPAEVAALIRYLCSDEAAFVTGSDFAIDGGLIRLNTP